MAGSSRRPRARQARPSGAAGDAVHAPLPRLFHLLPSEHAHVSKVSLAIETVGEASADQLVQLEAALAARRAA